MAVPSLWGWRPVPAPSFNKWLEAKDGRSGVELPLDLDEINSFVRQHVRYSGEAIDVWSPPKETLERGYGDCEDIAILKRSLFIEAGGKEEDSCLLVVWDQIARVHHAVLLVNVDGWKLLDSYNSLVLPIEMVRDYTPQFAYTGEEAWTYGR